jgi:hypothetical protein
MSETRRCEECGHKLDDGYTAEETLCGACFNEKESISWGELAELTHATQVERFGWCICEDPSQGQLADDCPREEATA